MRGTHRTAIALATALMITGSGCNSPARRSVAATTEPPLTRDGDSGVVIGDASTPSKVAVAPRPSNSIVDRHPLLSRPRDYYESSGNNKVVKTAAAAVVGVPAGIIGELRQIVVGAPRASAVPVATSY